MKPLNSTAKKALIIYTVFVAAWIGLLFAVSGFDLPLSVAAYDPHARWAQWIQSYGTLPGIVTYGLAFLFLPLCVPAGSPFRRFEIVQKSALTVLLMAVLQPFGITTLMKLAWGRLRFVQLHGDFSQFTHFYELKHAMEGVSFPSGHVATAAVLFPVAFLLRREGHRQASFVVFAVTAAWVVVTAAGRIVAGAHYLTDTLFSTGLALALAPPVARAGAALWNLLFRRPRTPDACRDRP